MTGTPPTGKTTGRILIWGADRVGDVVMTFPALKILKHHAPDAHITFATTDYARQVVQVSGMADEIVRVPFRGHFLLHWKFRNLRQRVRKGEFDHVLIFGKASRYSKHIGPLEDTHYDGTNKYHWAHALALQAFTALGLEPQEIPGPQIELPEPFDALQALATQGVSVSGRPYLVIHPGTNRTMRDSGVVEKSRTERNWPIEYFAKLAAHLAQDYPEIQHVYVGTTNECEWLKKELQSFPPEHTLNLCGQTNIPELLTLLRHAKALVCADSGVMHLATVVNTPIVGIFGPTDVNKTGAFGMGERLRPLRAMSFEEAQYNNNCMRNIPPQAVYDALADFL